MKKRALAATIVLCGGCESAFSQSTEAPSKTQPATTAIERETTQGAERPARARPGDPNTTGDDKVNGMDVPRMKGESEDVGRR